MHLCNEKCSLFGIAKGYCNKLCNSYYGHQGSHLCDRIHLCNKKCSLNGKSGGCNIDCCLKYGHQEECLCNAGRSSHTCQKTCKLCYKNCGHVYDHDNEDSLKCQKCLNEICVLSEKNHLCGNEHNCNEDCKEGGWCEIESNIVQNNILTYVSSLGENIEYKFLKFKEKQRKKCNINIPENEMEHESIHSCKSKEHKCGYPCIQCNSFCTLKYEHRGLHQCIHGNIVNSNISISNHSNEFALIKKKNNIYKFTQGETAKIFLCEEYCREQGQGHIHLFSSTNKIFDNNVKYKGLE